MILNLKEVIKEARNRIYFHHKLDLQTELNNLSNATNPEKNFIEEGNFACENLLNYINENNSELFYAIRCILEILETEPNIYFKNQSWNIFCSSQLKKEIEKLDGRKSELSNLHDWKNLIRNIQKSKATLKILNTTMTVTEFSKLFWNIGRGKLFGKFLQ
jgi:hypothetical protein